MKRNLFKKIISYFFQGLLFTVPIVIIFYIVYRLFIFLDGIIDLPIPGLGILLVFTTITLVGLAGTTFIGIPIRFWFKRLLKKAPLIKTIYTAITDLLSAFVGKKKRFNKPVKVKIGSNQELYKLGFVTEENLSFLGEGDDMVAVYLPHSYNFSGNLFLAPRKNITEIDMPAADMMTFIVSGGVSEISEENDEG